MSITIDAGALAAAVAMAVAAGLVGSFAVMRRMTLAADALSHVALPGIGIAIILRVAPLPGAVAALILGTVLIWLIENRTHISTETIVGVVFSVALAAGSMLTSGEELIDALFGASGPMSRAEVLFGIAASAIVSAYILTRRSQLVLAMVSPDIATTSGINVERIDLEYLLAFAITVALGLRFLGVLLMGSLMIIPAATARQLARNLSAMLAIATVTAVFATIAGTFAGATLHRQGGPMIISVAGAMFFVSLAFRRRA